LNKLDVEIPLGGLVCITGVSGSGKSTLVHEALVPGVKNYLKHLHQVKTCYHSISGVGSVDQIIELDQSPIGRTPKSNPATYTKLFDEIRKLYANTNEAKIRGFKQGRFSFNVKGGRCETCEGNGVIKVEMNFLPDVYITCSDCGGQRYNQETLNILYRGKNIADVLNMSIEEAKEFFANHKKIHRTLSVLDSVGLGYIKLGQSSTTLSGGEAQRMKLSRELAKATRGHCLYVLDEPTTGLHFKDIQILLDALNRLVEQGHSVLVIEHNLDVIKSADHIIDLGPEGGKFGGKVMATGTPEEVAKNKKSITGKYIKKVL
jgi:excinuclease ABC subunit A